MMYNNPEDPISEYENTINKLTDQITELFSKIHFYQALVAEKDHQITQLTNENHKLKAQIQNMPHDLKPPSPPNMQSYSPPSIPTDQSYISPPQPAPRQSSSPSPLEKPIDTISSNIDSRINKRVCPNCGAMGFAIREIDDKSNVISYIPRRIYAKKKSCTKCRYEW